MEGVSVKIPLAQKVLTLCTLAATLSLALGCFLRNSWLWAVLVIACGCFWLFVQRRGWVWVSSLELAIFVFTAAFLTLSGVSSGLMVFVLVSALCAWDLDCFYDRLKKPGHVVKKNALEKNHFKRLIAVVSFGLILCIPALTFNIHLGFKWILGLGIIMLAGLIWLINRATHLNHFSSGINGKPKN